MPTEKFKNYIEECKKVLSKEENKNLIEELYKLDLKQFQEEEASSFKESEKRQYIASLKYITKTKNGEIENPIKNFLNYRIRADGYDCDKSKCAREYYETKFGWKYENEHPALEKDTAQSFWNIYKTLLLMHDIENDCLEGNKSYKEIYYYKQYDDNALKAKYPKQEIRKLREKWLLENEVWEHYKSINENRELQRLSILYHTLGNMVILPHCMASEKLVKYKDCFYNIISKLDKHNTCFIKDYKYEFKDSLKLDNKEDLIELFGWNPYYNETFRKNEGKKLEKLPDLLLIKQTDVKEIVKEGEKTIKENKKMLEECIKILNQKIWEVTKNVIEKIYTL